MKHCATSLSEVAVGQRVCIVAGLGDVLPGIVMEIGPNHAEVAYDRGGYGLHRPYEIVVEGEPQQLELAVPMCALPGCANPSEYDGAPCVRCQADPYVRRAG